MTENRDTDSSTEGGTEDEESSEDIPIDANTIKTKFSNLATALQETNQNLVTFEYLLEHYTSSSRSSVKEVTTPSEMVLTTPKDLTPKSSKPDSEVPNNIDIVDLLKDICGSVNDLKTEMGQNSLKDVSKLDLLQIESKIQNSQKHAELLGMIKNNK